MEKLAQKESVWMRPMRGDIVRIRDLSETEAIRLYGLAAPFFDPEKLYEVDEVVATENGAMLRLKLYENRIRVAGKVHATRRDMPNELIAAQRCVVVERSGKRVKTEQSRDTIATV